MKIIYQLNKWHRNSFEPTEQTVAFYESWKDANLEMRTLEFNNSDWEYTIYHCKVIQDSETAK